MSKTFTFLFALSIGVLRTVSSFADCCYWGDCCESIEFGAGWRRDTLDWKVKHLDSSYISHADVDSHIRFNDIDMYTVNGKFRWVGTNYYIRLSGMYGLSEKGRAKQHFNIEDSYLFCSDSVSVHTSNRIKRNSEFYDFDLAVGYPLTFFCCRLAIIPTIGFSYDRQRINVREKHHSSSSSYCSCHHRHRDRDRHLEPITPIDKDKRRHRRHHHSDSSSSSFSVDSSSNPFRCTPSSNPFSSSSSSENIASALGLSNDRESANYRFSWYGPLAGVDIAFALDPCWTLFAEFEGHFLNSVHRKRKSWTGVYFVDDYHHKGWAYGFDGTVGTTFCFYSAWFSSINIVYKWWKGHSKDDELHWKSVSANVTIGYIF